LRKSGKPVLFQTQDYGNTWVEGDSALVEIPRPNLSASLQLNKTQIFGSKVVSNNPYDKNAFWIFENFGSSAKEIKVSNLIGSEVVNASAFENDSTGIILTNNKNVFRTTNSLKNLTEIAQLEGTPFCMDYAEKVGSHNGFYILGTNSGSYFSINGGLDWMIIGDAYPHKTLTFYNSDIGLSSGTGSGERIRYFQDVLNSVSPNLNVSNELRIYPNPVNSKLNIEYNQENEIRRIQVQNLQGEMVLLFSNNNDLDVSSLANGIYLLSIQTNKGNLVSKFIKY
jgi:hypothetical protein